MYNLAFIWIIIVAINIQMKIPGSAYAMSFGVTLDLGLQLEPSSTNLVLQIASENSHNNIVYNACIGIYISRLAVWMSVSHMFFKPKVTPKVALANLQTKVKSLQASYIQWIMCRDIQIMHEYNCISTTHCTCMSLDHGFAELYVQQSCPYVTRTQFCGFSRFEGSGRVVTSLSSFFSYIQPH